MTIISIDRHIYLIVVSHTLQSKLASAQGCSDSISRLSTITAFTALFPAHFFPFAEIALQILDLSSMKYRILLNVSKKGVMKRRNPI